MAYAMTKHGTLDNVVTNEFICDAAEDLDLIDKKDITLGSVAIVLHGDAGIEVYMADSTKEWISMSATTEEEEEEEEPAGGGE